MLKEEAIYKRSPVWLQNVLLNAHAWRIRRHRYGAPLDRATDLLDEQSRWSPERIRELQSERLRHVVAAAYDRTAYYREAFDAAGVKPSDIRGVDDIHRLPLLTKLLAQRNAERMRSLPEPGPGWWVGRTSGTTGSPLTIWYDRETCIQNNACDALLKRWVGMTDADYLAVLLGRVITPIEQREPPFWRTNHVLRQVWFSSFHLTPEHLDEYVAEIRRRGLRFLEGYPSTLYILATHLLRKGERLPLRGTISSSETLHAAQREAIEEAFQCRNFDFYALAERVLYAIECEHRGGGKHLVDPFGYTEVVDAEGNPVPDGQPGYLVGTSLFNTAMPMIRYRTGDVSAIVTEPCACGRSYRRIVDVTTKAEDILVTPDGRMISPSTLTHPFKPLVHVVTSQIVQESPDLIVVKLVTSPGFTVEEERGLAESLAERIGGGVTIRIEHVAELPREKSGKFRWIVNKVAHSTRIDWTERPR